ncbi:glycosyltransferase [Desulfonatronospira thiodismutans]|uniref:glycosyltransferase n=1 Tax=Desulfonatronospira thiodismutans TaxID=488939 RepID=UPI0013754B5B|nr:glycosyltransferase [Desulfonatronospira thiodismutans]
MDQGIVSGQIKEDIFAQIGFSSYIPKAMKYELIMEKQHFENVLRSSTAIISHAGMGTISLALSENKALLVFPRLVMYKEMVNDHQLSTARKFEETGHVLAAYTSEELYEKIRLLKNFTPKPRYSSPERVSRCVGRFMQNINLNCALKKEEQQ